MAILWDETRYTFNQLLDMGLDATSYESHLTLDYVRNLKINTLEGSMFVNKGDYIIRGIKGEFYPCKADIFTASYDEVQEDELCEQCGRVLLPFRIKSGICEICEKDEEFTEIITGRSTAFLHPELHSDFNAGIFTADQYSTEIIKHHCPDSYELAIQEVTGNESGLSYTYENREVAEADMKAFINRNQDREC